MALGAFDHKSKKPGAANAEKMLGRTPPPPSQFSIQQSAFSIPSPTPVTP